MTDVGNIQLTHIGLSFKITALKCRDYFAYVQKKHEINNNYMISVPTNCLSCKLGCQATADFMRKLKEHNLIRACLAGGAPGLCGSGKKEALVCRRMYVF